MNKDGPLKGRRHDPSTLCHPAELTHLRSISFPYSRIFFLHLQDFSSIMCIINYVIVWINLHIVHYCFFSTFSLLAYNFSYDQSPSVYMPHVFIQYSLHSVYVIVITNEGIRRVLKHTTVFMSACVQMKMWAWIATQKLLHSQDLMYEVDSLLFCSVINIFLILSVYTNLI